MRSRAIVFGARLVLSIGLACAAGCGIKTRPRPPEDIKPGQILDLHAKPVADGVQLIWTRPEKYQSGDPMRDLSEFVLLRAEGSGPMAEVAKLPITDQQRFQQQHHMLLTDKGTLMNHRYRYRVIAVTSDGYQSLPSNEAVIVRTPPPEPGVGPLTPHAPATKSQPSNGAAPAARAP